MTIHYNNDSLIGIPRKENNSLYLIHPKSYPRPCFVNDYIFNLWKSSDNMTIEELLIKFFNMYKEIPNEKIKKDVIQGLLYLYNLEMIDLLGNDLEVIKAMSDNKTAIVNECDFRAAFHYLVQRGESNGFVYDFKLDKQLEANQIKEFYNIPAMRANQIHLEELYIKIMSARGMLNGVAGICILNNGNVCYITFIATESDDVFVTAINEVKSFMLSKKIKIIKIKSKNEKLVNLLLKDKFLIEAVLLDEAENEEKIYIVRSPRNDCQ